jgi:hypothetical protein
MIVEAESVILSHVAFNKHEGNIKTVINEGG